MGDDVELECGTDALFALADGLTQFGAIGAFPEWLVSGVWLCVGITQFIATASVEVLSDGFVARFLDISSPDEFVAKIEANLPDVAGRLLARGSATSLSENVIPPPAVPASLKSWPPVPYSMSVIVRTSKRASNPHRVACGLHFVSEAGDSLLVGTDITSIAMVMSQDPLFIEGYLNGCSAYTPDEYLESFGATLPLRLRASPSAR